LEQLISSVVLNIPNFSVALLVVYWQSKMIDKLLDNQAKLLDKLLDQIEEIPQTD